MRPANRPAGLLNAYVRIFRRIRHTLLGKPADIKIGIILVPRATRFQVTRHPVVLVFVAVRSTLLLPR